MQKVYFKDTNGNRVCGILSIPNRASTLVITSHGFTSNKDSKIYRELQEELNTQGIGTLRYDYYGRGESDGKFEETTLTKTLASLQAAIQYAQTQCNTITLVGASFGGLLSLLAAARDPSIQALVLKSSVIDPILFWKQRLTPERIERWKKEGILHYDDCGERFDLNYTFWEDLQMYHTLDEAKNIHCPTLIMHGDQDTVVPISQSQTLARLLNTPLHVVHGADHNYVNPEQYNEMKKVLIDFITFQLLNH
ncbi:MAG TPA: alpha/beta fold hydrolase [Candidatus Nanoarchaeia archaeon]|nr:alpha/beta fold hydrolase [Candidatus Nanoarchaeia archaeon]